MATIEQKTAETLLQKPQEVIIGNKHYSAAPPTIATLVLVSEAISQMPKLELDPEGRNIVGECLRSAKDCRFLGDVAAILILGGKRLRKGGRRLFCRNERKALARDILENYSPSGLQSLIAALLQRLELGDFFALTAFLQDASLAKATRAVNQTTASGR